MLLKDIVNNVEKIKSLNVQVEELNKQIENTRLFTKVTVYDKEMNLEINERIAPIVARILRKRRNDLIFEMRKLGVTFPED